MRNSAILNKIINGRTKYSKKQFNSPKYIGSMSKIFNENSFESLNQYKVWYSKNILSEKQLYGHCIDIENEVGKEFNIFADEIYEYLYDLVFVKTWDGFMRRQKNAKQTMTFNGVTNIRESTPREDAVFAIDFFGTTLSGEHIAIQVKPHTFKWKAYEYHYIQNLKKNLKFLKKNKSYSKMVYMFEKKGNFTYRTYTLEKLKDIV